MSGDEILNHRKNKFLTIGRTKGFVSQSDDLITLSRKKNKFNTFIEGFFFFFINLVVILVTIILLSYLIFFL